MNPKELADFLEQLLSKRLVDAPVTESVGPLGAVRKLIHRLRKCLFGEPGVHSQVAQQDQRIARIRCLPPHVHELLRRYYVFLEAEENICSSMGMSSGEFHRLRREASDYILSLHERKPDFEPLRAPPGDRT
ncbi:MAG: hypothetical protein ABSH40_21340 [Bryobacteraceae bacterium]|jgi:hypothetical protein